MTDHPEPSPRPEPSPSKAALRAARNERLAQALRENLKRRKHRTDAVEAAERSTTLSGAVLSSKSSARGGSSAG